MSNPARDYLSALTGIPADDDNFKSARQDAPLEDLNDALQYAAEKGQKTRFGALRSEINRRTAESGLSSKIPSFDEYRAGIAAAKQQDEIVIRRLTDDRAHLASISLLMTDASTPVLQAAAEQATGERKGILIAALEKRGITFSAAPGGSSEQPAQANLASGGPQAPQTDSIAPGKSLAIVKAKPAVELEVVEPDQLIPTKSVHLVNTFSTENLEMAIGEALANTEMHRTQSALWDLRSGVLFHLYRESLKVNGRKYTGFWERCEKKFGVPRSTISKKMRLANTWAKEQGAGDEALQQLAAAADFNDPHNEAVQLAFEWIGDQTTSDLYRKYKLVNYGPQGGDTSDHPRKSRRTKDEIDSESFEAKAEAQCLIVQTQVDKLLTLTGPKKEQGWWILEDAELEKLKLSVKDLYDGIVEFQGRRAARRKK